MNKHTECHSPPSHSREHSRPIGAQTDFRHGHTQPSETNCPPCLLLLLFIHFDIRITFADPWLQAGFAPAFACLCRCVRRHCPPPQLEGILTDINAFFLHSSHHIHPSVGFALRFPIPRILLCPFCG